MKAYKYEVVDVNGKILKGYLDAENYEEALDFLGLKNVYVVSLKQIPGVLAALRHLVKQRITNVDLIQFAKNLSVMLKAGIILTVALSDIGENITKERLKNIIENIRDLVEKGLSLSEAVERHKDVFPPVFRYLIKIGEETGRLDRSLDDIALHFQRIEDLKTAIKRALMYPIFATVVSVGAMIFWIIYVLPKVVLAMKGMGVKIPFITSWMLEVGLLGKKFLFFVPFIIILGFFFAPFFNKSKRIKMMKSYLSFKLPIFKQIFYNRALALFCEQMRILFGAGVPLDISFNMTANVVENEIMKRAILNSKERILTGKRISDSLKEEKIFPSMVIRLVDVGESSGTIEEQFGFLSNFYTTYLQEYSARLGKVIEPVMISVIGIFFAIVLISLLGPVYELISGIGKG